MRCFWNEEDLPDDVLNTFDEIIQRETEQDAYDDYMVHKLQEERLDKDERDRQVESETSNGTREE